MERPLDKQTVDNICIANGLRNAKELAAASIRQFVSIVKDIEKKTGVEYIRMEIGEPGLPAEQIGIEAEHEVEHHVLYLIRATVGLVYFIDYDNRFQSHFDSLL